MARWNTPEDDKAKARELVSAGHGAKEVGKLLGYTHTTIKVWTDPVYASKRAGQIAEASITSHANSRSQKRRMPSMPRVPM